MDLDRDRLLESNRRWLELAYRELAAHQEEVKRLQQEIKSMEFWLASVEKGQSAMAGANFPLAHDIDTIDATDTVETELKGDRLREEVVKILTEVFPEELYYREILRRLQRRGFEVGGKDPGLNLLAHLAREPRVQRGFKRGVYTLSPMHNR